MLISQIWIEAMRTEGQQPRADVRTESPREISQSNEGHGTLVPALTK